MLFAALDSMETLLIAMVGIIFVVGSAVDKRLRASDQRRLRRLERKLDMLLRHFGMDPETAAGLSPEVRQLADEGKKIEAIKLHREQTGAGLKEAKEAVEGYMDSK